MPTQAGQMLAHYRLIEKIGEGGMGVVWKAADTSLDREVAIKILPAELSADPDRLARFEREARVVASLNHPNIASVYSVHASEGVRFLAMELVAGENLAARLARGPLPVPEALAIGRQVAEALEAAHDKGVVHRDLKPANIQVTPDGKVKVLDFGLAKVFEPDLSSIDPSMSPTLTSVGTRAGVILGTAAYMSPEQARGRSADKRADIWAFGCVLYELFARRQTFAGETASDMLAAVLKTEPEWEAIPADTPRAIRRLLGRCLQKDPRQRLHDIADARIIMEEVLAAPAEETIAEMPAHPASALWRILLPVAALLVGAAAASVAVWNLRPTPPEPLLRKFAVPVEKLGSVTISADGQHVAYVSGDRLWIRDFDRLEARELADTDGADQPFWSPDSTWVAYGANGTLWKVPVDGGPPSAICELPDGRWSSAAGGAWYPDGTIIFTTGNSGLLKVTAQGGDATSLLDPTPDVDADFHDASALPEGRGVLFVVHKKGGGFDTIDVLSGDVRATLLTVEGQELRGPVYSPTGHVLFRRSPRIPGIWAVPFSLDSLEATGEPFLVVADANVPSVSSDGSLAYAVRDPFVPSQPVRADRTGRVVEEIGQPEEHLPFPTLSPDGGRVAVAALEHNKSDIWVHDLGRGTRTRLTFDGDCYAASWSPDGKHLVYFAGQGVTDLHLRLRAADSTGESRDLGRGFMPSYSPDGKHVVYSAFNEQGDIDLFSVTLEGTGEPDLILATPSADYYPRISPDGRYLAYMSAESGRSEVFVSRFPSGQGKWQVSVDGGNWPVWSGDGDELFFTESDTIFAVRVATEPTLILDTPRKLFDRKPPGIPAPYGWPAGFDVSADGEHFVFVEATSADRGEPSFAIVLNWFEEFGG